MSADDDHDSLIKGVDSRVHQELDPASMSETILRNQLDQIEASITEVRKQELGVDDRLAEIQKEKDELVATRAALEEAGNLIRQRLGRPASSIVVQLSTSRPARPQQPVALVPRRKTRPDSKRDRHLAVLKPLMENEQRSASRQDIKQAWLDAGLLEGSQNIESAVSGMLTHFKNYGFITTDNRGTWTWIGLR